MEAAHRRIEAVARQVTCSPTCQQAHDASSISSPFTEHTLPKTSSCADGDSEGTTLGFRRSPCASAVSQSDGLLAGQVAIITGAGKGIGEAASKLLASHGASIVVADLDAAAAEQVVTAILSEGGRAVSVAGDVTAPGVPEAIVKAAVDAFGRIDILVNNAGYTWDGVIPKITPDQWDNILAVHCTAPFRLIQAAAPHMREAAKVELGGPSGAARPRSIVNISSTSGTHGNAGQANYATAKAGVVGLTKSVAKEWGPFGIRCNAIAFGLIDTRLTQPKESGATIQVGGKSVPLGLPQGDQWRQAAQMAIPLQRLGTAAEAAGAILMLVSPWASYITGQVLEVNGGHYM